MMELNADSKSHSGIWIKNLKIFWEKNREQTVNNIPHWKA